MIFNLKNENYREENDFYKTIIKLLENKKPPKKSAVSILRRGRDSNP